MTFFLFTIIFVAVCVFIVLKTSKKEPQKHQQSQQPIRFDLLDDNGNPLPNEPVVHELQYFCIKDKGYHVTVWPKDQGMQNLDYIEFDIAGMSYRENIDEYLGEHVGTLEAEPTNPYDANAIKILAEDGHHVGYVPKDMTGAVRDFATLPCTCYFYIGNNDGIYYSDAYISNVSPNKFSNTPNHQ